MPLPARQGPAFDSALHELTKGAKVPTLGEAENILIARAMEIARDNVAKAADMLGISRQTLYRKLKVSRRGMTAPDKA
ncbi:MAG: hypothetical protein GX608_02270 [Lentisphaerae bacterium]|nr:hypothetical protein [Lentisphaerota bacterium]